MRAGPESYDEKYYLESCGGAEFFRLYGAAVLKPQLDAAFQSAALRPGMSVRTWAAGRSFTRARLRAWAVPARP